MHPIYEQIIDEWERELEDLERTVFTALKNSPDGCTRRQLVYLCFGVVILENQDTNNNKYDRKVRKTIEAMREKLIPIFSSSSGAGYRLDISETSLSLMIAEWERRRDTYADKVRRAYQMRNRIREAGERAASMPQAPTQFRLI